MGRNPRRRPAAPPPPLISAAPPHNIEAEQACLGSCLIDPEAVDQISEHLRGAECFYREAHQEIWRAILHLAERGQNIDLITVSDQLKSVGQLELAGGPSYLDSLISLVQSSAHASAYARIVVERAIERRLQQAGSEIIRAVHDPDLPHAEKVDHAEQLVLGVADFRRADQLVQIELTLDEVLEDIYQKFEAKEAVTGLPTGFRDLDALTSGLQAEDLIIVGARPSMGKTAFSMAIASHAAGTYAKAQEGQPPRRRRVAVFSLEMSRNQLVSRLMCSAAQVSMQDVRRGTLREMDFQRLARARNAFGDLGLHIDDTVGVTVLDVKTKARRMQRRGGLDLIVIDYLQLMRGTGKTQNREQEISEISRHLKGLAKELKIPIVALSQVSRGPESRTDKRPGLADLRESGALEQDADLVIFLYRDEYHNPLSEDAGTAEVIIAKHRNGPVDTVRLAFVKKFAAFRDLQPDLPPPRQSAAAGVVHQVEFTTVPG